jgi:D-sedoheptulose 7-phosphate isomerase
MKLNPTRLAHEEYDVVLQAEVVPDSDGVATSAERLEGLLTTSRKQAIHSLREGAMLRLQLIETCLEAIVQSAHAIYMCLEGGGKVLFFGNGGSAADAQHLAAEFVGRFVQDRLPLAGIALTTDTSALTAIGNDYGFEHVYSRQVRALGRVGDVALGISTSGQSGNVLAGIESARERGLITIGLTGGDGGRLAPIVDIPIVIPSTSTARIQECHMAIGHILCELVDARLLGEPA